MSGRPEHGRVMTDDECAIADALDLLVNNGYCVLKAEAFDRMLIGVQKRARQEIWVTS